MENSVAYSIVKWHIEKKQIICGYKELVEWLERLHRTAQITEDAIDDLLQRADYLRSPIISALSISEQVKKYGSPVMMATFTVAACL